MKIVVVFPTPTELKAAEGLAGIIPIVSGIGLRETAYKITKIIEEYKPDWLIMAGIAGVYAHSPIKIGDVVLVSKEFEADIGFYTKKGFTHLVDLAIDMEFDAQAFWECPYLELGFPLKPAVSNSMNCAMAPFIETNGVDIENMEGAAFFQVCLAEGQKFLEVRSISNRVTLEDEPWEMESAVNALRKGLIAVIGFLQNTKVGNEPSAV